MKKLGKIFIIIICLIILMYLFDIQSIILKQFYPLKYEEYVNYYAKEYEVDPLLIFAIMKTESNFNSDAKSTSNAKGLMQLMDSTAIELAGSENIDLYDPKTSIWLGTKYISYLLDTYEDNMVLALIAYNAGMGNLHKWVEEGTIREDGTDVENIPFKETSMYVRKILRDYSMYIELY